MISTSMLNLRKPLFAERCMQLNKSLAIIRIKTVKIGAEAASFLIDTNEETIVFNIGTIYNNLKNPRVKALTISMSLG